MNRSDTLGPSSVGSHLRTRVTVAALAALSLAVAAVPGVRARLTHPAPTTSGVTLPPGPHFSDPPTDDEFARAGLFDQPLIPVGPTSPEENAQLGSLLVAYSKALFQGERDDVQPIADFVTQHPRSAWTPGLEMELGAVYRQTGHFSKAFATWQSAWAASKDLTSPDGRIVGDMSAAYLSQFEAYLGRKEILAPLLEELRTRPIRGTAAELVSESSRGMAEMESRPDVAFKCGPSALSRILKRNPTQDVPASRRVLAEAKSTPDGLSLSAVQAISVEAGMNYQMAYRSPGAPLLVPAVAHWKMGHYAAVVGRDARGRLSVGDATFGEDIALEPATFDEETSGYFLVPSGPLPPGWRHVDADEGSSVWGRGDTGGNHDNGATGRAEVQAFACGPGGGCTRWNVEAAVTGLELRDDPVGYTPPFGPEMRFPMTYSHRDALQPPKFTYTNFGNKWTFDWLSYVMDDSNNFSGEVVDGSANGQLNTTVVPGNYLCADLYRRGGGDEPYIFYGAPSATGVSVTTTLTSAGGQFSQAYLTRFVDPKTGAPTYFTRTLPDGSVEWFTLPLGTPGAPKTKFFMTEVDDPQGNAVKINYDAQMRITWIADAAGQKSVVCYNDSYKTDPAHCAAPIATKNPPSNLQITQIVDPFLRSASFGYDPMTGHLTSITDVLNITSSYQYGEAGPSVENVDFVNTLTTPYGTTSFTYTDSINLPTAGTSRSVKITETSALGNVPPRTSFVKFFQGNNPPCRAITTPTIGYPSGTTVDGNGIECVGEYAIQSQEKVVNQNLQYRNTFVWNAEQYAVSFNPASTVSPYLGAKIFHWLHADTDPNDTNTLTASRVLESIKEPLESRVWFLYLDQAGNLFDGDLSPSQVGVTNQPIAIIRALGDGTFQKWQFVYDAYGHVTQSIDPVGRTLTMAYAPAPNNVDLLSVTNTTPGVPAATLLTFGGYVKHRPHQVTGANGQTTQLLYNPVGQLTSSTDPLNNTWTYSYSPYTSPTATLSVPAACTGAQSCGFLTGIVGPAVSVPAAQGGGQQIPTYSFTHDSVGRLLTKEGPDQRLLTFSYDNADRLTKTLFPDGTTELRGYTSAGAPLLDLTSFTDRMGYTTTREYDGFRDLIEIDEPSGRTTKLSYGLDGTVQTVTDPLNHVTTYTTDVQGRVETITNQDYSTQLYAYDVLGRVVSTSPDQGVSAPGTTQYAYNLDNTVSKAFLDWRAPTVFTYDPAYSRLSGWSRIQQGTWAQPTCASTSCPILDQEKYTYYPAGVSGAGRVQQVTTTLALPSTAGSASPTIVTSSYAYDALDRVLAHTITTPVGTEAEEYLQYDAMGRLTQENNLLDSFGYTYNDATARVSGRTSQGGPQIAASYFPPQQDGLLQELSYTGYDGSDLADYSYGYDARHNVTSFSDSNVGNFSYAYDAYNQINKAVLPNISLIPRSPSLPTLSVVCDPSGNITSQQTVSRVNASVTTNTLALSYDTSNKAIQETTSATGSSTLVQKISNDVSLGSLDMIGVVGTNQEVIYGYDASNRLGVYYSEAWLSTQSGPFSDFYYDGLGRLSEVSESYNAHGPVTTLGDHSYAWCGQKMCLEVDNEHLTTILGSAQTTPLPDALYVAQGTVTNVAGSEFTYDITDLLGSERAVVTNDEITAQYTYDTFGNRSTVMGSPTASNRGFAGLYYHATSGLQFARNRVYDASLGRWLTRDPIGTGHAFDDPARFNATDLNLYAYAGNNPQSMVDPSGNEPWAIVEFVERAGVAIVEEISHSEAFEHALEGGNVATDSNEAATALAEEVSAAKGGPGTATAWEQHGPGEKHVHAESFEPGRKGKPARFPGHIFFNADLFDVLIPFPPVLESVLRPGCGDGA